jgi:hypothetical protein
MAIPTQFSVTNTLRTPIANSSTSLDTANPATPESAQGLDDASPANAVSVGILEGADIIGSVALPVIDGAEQYTAQSVVVIGLPSAASTQSQPSTDTPSVAGSVALPTLDNATAATSEALPTTDTPSVANALAATVADAPSLAGTQVQPSADTPSVVNTQTQPNTATPSAASGQAIYSAPTPSALTARAGTLTVPPFPLNHARILSSNKLQVYSSVSSDVGGDSINALKPNTFERWTPTGDGYFKVVLTSSQPIDTICLGAHNLGDRGVTVNPQYRETDGGPLIQFAGARTATTNAPIMFHRSSSVDVRVVEIYLSGNTDAEVGYISAGLALQMQRPFFNGHVPITDADVTQYYHNKTESGNIIGQAIRSQGYKTSYSWENIDDTWYRTYFAPFKQAIKTQPFFIAWNLLEYPLDVGFGRVAQDISTPMQNGTVTKRGGLSFEFLGY